MVQNKKLNFIVIDDSKLDCFIAEKVIRNTGRSASIISFLEAKQALEYIGHLKVGADEHIILLVDIQMPIMNGFQFVEEFQAFPDEITTGFTVFIYSSSINDNDLKRVTKYPAVRQFLNKPLNSNVLGALIQQL